MNPGSGIGNLLLGVIFTVALLISIMWLVIYEIKGRTFKVEKPIQPKTELVIKNGAVDTIYVYEF